MNATTRTPVTLGQEVVVLHHSGSIMSDGPRAAFGYKVTKITPTGQITVTHAAATAVDAEGLRFKPSGSIYGWTQIGGSSYSSIGLDFDVAGRRAEVARRERAIKAINAISAVQADRTRHSWGIPAMQKEVERLEALVAAARQAVDAIDPPAEATALAAEDGGANAHDDPAATPSERDALIATLKAIRVTTRRDPPETIGYGEIRVGAFREGWSNALSLVFGTMLESTKALPPEVAGDILMADAIDPPAEATAHADPVATPSALPLTSASFRVVGVTKPGHFCTWVHENIIGRNGFCQHLFDDHFSIAAGSAANTDLSGTLHDIQLHADFIARNFCARNFCGEAQ